MATSVLGFNLVVLELVSRTHDSKRVLPSNHVPDPVFGSMAEAFNNLLAFMTDDDLQAISVYLKSLPSDPSRDRTHRGRRMRLPPPAYRFLNASIFLEPEPMLAGVAFAMEPKG